MPWSHPAARMREFILALRAIWACWNDGDKLDFRGEFYRHTLMTPFFNPGPNPYGTPKVFLAAVGERMTEVAGEVADGIILHGFTTERYVREVTLPALERGWAAAPASNAATSSSPARCSSSPAPTRRSTRRRGRARSSRSRSTGRRPRTGACSSSTAGATCRDDLNRLSKQGEWVQMGELIDDEILDTFAVSASPRTSRRAARALRRRGRPGQLLRAVQERPRALVARRRGVQDRGLT